jgi:hypothetical protein
MPMETRPSVRESRRVSELPFLLGLAANAIIFFGIILLYLITFPVK